RVRTRHEHPACRRRSHRQAQCPIGLWPARRGRVRWRRPPAEPPCNVLTPDGLGAAAQRLALADAAAWAGKPLLRRRRAGAAADQAAQLAPHGGWPRIDVHRAGAEVRPKAAKAGGDRQALPTCAAGILGLAGFAVSWPGALPACERPGTSPRLVAIG